MHMDKITSGFTVKSLETEPAPLAEIPVMAEAGFSCGRIAFIGVYENVCSGPLTVRRRWGNLFRQICGFTAGVPYPFLPDKMARLQVVTEFRYS